jgi:hypothetical protein
MEEGQPGAADASSAILDVLAGYSGGGFLVIFSRCGLEISVTFCAPRRMPTILSIPFTTGPVVIFG